MLSAKFLERIIIVISHSTIKRTPNFYGFDAYLATKKPVLSKKYILARKEILKKLYTCLMKL